MRAGVRTGLRLAGGAVLLLVIAVGIFVWQPLWVNDQILRAHLWRQGVQSHYVTVDGYKVHYYEARPPHQVLSSGARRAEIPLVLVHGLGARGEDWSAMIPTLAAKGFHVYVPDLLGYGRSAKPDVDYSIRLQEKLVVDFMSAMGLPRADIGGWSMGGWITLRLAVDHPAMVERVVVFDAAGVYFPPTFDASLFVPTDAAGVSKLFAMLTPHPQPLPGFAAKAALRRLQANGWVLRRNVASMETGRDLLDFQLQNVRQPTLIVWGKQDTLIPLSAGETMHDRIAESSLLVVDGCGHLAPAECAPPILKGMVEFLRAEPAVVGVVKEVAGK